MTRRASLSFGYDEQKVNHIRLSVVFKESFTGEWNKKVGDEEQKKSADGTRVESKEGDISFAGPLHLPDIKKSVWGESGLGYFLSNPADPGAELIAVKIFFADGKVDEAKLNERIEADLKGQQMTSLPREKLELADLNWVRVSDGATRIHLYSSKGKKIYQIQIVTGGGVWQQKWLYPFLNSIKID